MILSNVLRCIINDYFIRDYKVKRWYIKEEKKSSETNQIHPFEICNLEHILDHICFFGGRSQMIKYEEDFSSHVIVHPKIMDFNLFLFFCFFVVSSMWVHIFSWTRPIV